MKTAINKCPHCGGPVKIYAKVPVSLLVFENGDIDLLTEEQDIMSRSELKTPIECECFECGEIVKLVKKTEADEYVFAEESKSFNEEKSEKWK